MDSYANLRRASCERVADAGQFIERWFRLAESADPKEWEALTGANPERMGERVTKMEISAVAPKRAIRLEKVLGKTKRFILEAKRRILEEDQHDYDDYCCFFPGPYDDQENALAFADKLLSLMDEEEEEQTQWEKQSDKNHEAGAISEA